MWENSIHLFREYMGTGLLVIWFLISLLYLFCREHRKHIRILFVYVPVLLLLVFFNPLFARLVYGVVGEEIYYRILWLLPITVVIAFATVHIFGRLQGPVRYGFAIVAGCLIMVSGSLIYENPYFHKAENAYHVPQSVADICDAIIIEGREVMAVFPAEMLPYVRQYSALVCMPYGREIMVSTWAHLNELYDVMEAEEIDVPLLVQYAREQLCVYIILPENKTFQNGELAEYEFAEFGRMHGYVIYKDETVTLTLESGSSDSSL